MPQTVSPSVAPTTYRARQWQCSCMRDANSEAHLLEHVIRNMVLTESCLPRLGRQSRSVPKLLWRSGLGAAYADETKIWLLSYNGFGLLLLRRLVLPSLFKLHSLHPTVNKKQSPHDASNAMDLKTVSSGSSPARISIRSNRFLRKHNFGQLNI